MPIICAIFAIFHYSKLFVLGWSSNFLWPNSFPPPALIGRCLRVFLLLLIDFTVSDKLTQMILWRATPNTLSSSFISIRLLPGTHLRDDVFSLLSINIVRNRRKGKITSIIFNWAGRNLGLLIIFGQNGGRDAHVSRAADVTWQNDKKQTSKR